MATDQTKKWERLPGWEIVSAGLRDMAENRTTPEACAIWIALPKLRRAGVVDDRLLARPISDPELTAYRLMRTEGGDAYSRYNALLRRLIRFEHALERVPLARGDRQGRVGEEAR